MVYRPDTRYAWRGKKFPVEASKAAEHISDLEKTEGAVTAKNLLESARPEDSTLHPCYEWDDTIAAEAYRESQSKQILQSLTVIVESEQKKPVQTRAYFNITPIGSGEYVNAETVVTSPDLREQALRRITIELKQMQSKMKDFQELTAIYAAIDEYLNLQQGA